MKPNRRLIWFALSIVVVCALLGGIYGNRVEATAGVTSSSSLSANLKRFTRVYNLAVEKYAVPLQPNHCIFGPTNSMTVGAIPGMLRTLDPHSNFFDPKAFQALEMDQEGKYYGVGMEIELGLDAANKLAPEVVYPFPGSPAMRAGIRAHDVITRVNNKSTINLNIDSVANMLRGPKGTIVNVTVSRIGYPKPFEFKIRRAAIKADSLDSAFLIRPNIGYIHIRDFDETTNPELTRALRRMDAQHLRGLIIDLRDNPGGLLREAVEVASHFLKKGQLIVYQYGRESPVRRYYATGDNQGNNYPIVVLINHDTASAAEIVTGALQDHSRALVMGTTSFGKGLVQTVFPLSAGAGLALTTAHYYTPSGRLIQRSYSGLSLWDYFNHYGEPSNAHREVYYTDGGRKVYGGGGITPDVVFHEPKLSAFERSLLVHYAFFKFAKLYIAAHPKVSRDFEPDQAVLHEFNQFLAKQKIAASPQNLAASQDFIQGRIKEYVLTSAYGGQEVNQLSAETDPEVQKAITELPAAAQLTLNAKRYMASRGLN